MFQHSAPTLLAYGGTYTNLKEMNVENILLFAFPFSIGGPKMKQKVKVSYELCIQLYMKLSLRQFMEGATILVMNHIYNRQMSYKSWVMICRSAVDGTPLGEKLSTLSMTDLETINDKKTIIWMQIQEVFWKPYLPHAELWAILKKQQSILEGSVLQCWIIMDWTVYF